VGMPPQYITKTLRPTQPPTLSRMGNKPEFGDALWLDAEQVKLCDPSLT